MKSKLLTVLVVAGGILLIAGPMFAHHAGTNYERENPLTLSGIVTEFEFVNPHSLIHFDVKEENGMVSHWVAQGGSPSGIYKEGWTRDTLKPGDPITITGFASKDGRKVMVVGDAKPPGKDHAIIHPNVKTSR